MVEIVMMGMGGSTERGACGDQLMSCCAITVVPEGPDGKGSRVGRREWGWKVVEEDG